MRRFLSNACLTGLVLLLLTPRHACACGQGGAITVTNLPNFDTVDYNVLALTPGGQLGGNIGSFGTQPFIDSNGVVTVLGTLGGSSAHFHAMNDNGQAVGDSLNNDSSETLAFLYAGGNLLNLGTLGGGYSSANAVNNAGLVVGVANTTGDAQQHAFLFTNGVMLDLGDLGGGSSSATLINNFGVITGTSTTTNGNTHAFLYANGVMSDLGDLGGGSSSPNAMNDAGVVVGQSAAADGNNHAVAWSGGVMTDLGTVGGTSASATAVNSQNQVIGAYTAADGSSHGFFYAGGSISDLGNLGGANTTPLSMNNLGQVVGTADNVNTATSWIPSAFLWTNGVMVDLNTLLPANSPWILMSAQFINDSGRIVGIGIYNLSTVQTYIMDLGGSGGAPTAVATGPAQTVNCGTQVTLDGSGSSGASPLSYQWTENGNVLGNNSTLAASFGVGTHHVTLTVTDPCNDSSQASVSFQVADLTAPVIASQPASLLVTTGERCHARVPNVAAMVVASDNCTPANALVVTQSPAAGTVVDAGVLNVTVTVKDTAGNSTQGVTTLYVLDARAPGFLCAPERVVADADAVTGLAAVPNVTAQVVPNGRCTPANLLVVTQSPAAGTMLGAGLHNLTVTVTDPAGRSSSRTVVFKVRDVTPPVIQVATATPNVLSPANGRFVPVVLSVTARDNCDPSPTIKITHVDNTDCDSDVQVTGNLTLNLKAAQKSHGASRVYTVTVRCTDASGNSSTAKVNVTVPGK